MALARSLSCLLQRFSPTYRLLLSLLGQFNPSSFSCLSLRSTQRRPSFLLALFMTEPQHILSPSDAAHPLLDDSPTTPIIHTQDDTEPTSPPSLPSNQSDAELPSPPATLPEPTTLSPSLDDQPPSYIVPRRRPPPPKKGILKPPRQTPKSVFGSFRPRELVGSLGAKLLGADVEPRPPPTARERERDRLASIQASASPGGQAGAFLSRAFGKLSAVAAGSVGGSGSTGPTASSASGGASAVPGGVARTTSASSEPSASLIHSHSTHNSSSPSISPQYSSEHQPYVPSASSSTPSAVLPGQTPLKRAAFVLHSISVTYPISSALPPYSPSVSQSIQEVENQQRKKLVEQGGWAWWTGPRLVELYERACRVREEQPIQRIIELLHVRCFGSDSDHQEICPTDGERVG